MIGGPGKRTEDIRLSQECSTQKFNGLHAQVYDLLRATRLNNKYIEPGHDVLNVSGRDFHVSNI